MKTRCINLLIALVLALWGTASLAATTTTTFGVSATIVDSCSVSATALGFGNVDPVSLAGTAVDATTTVDVTCANGTAYDVGLDAGTATGATVTTRQMTSGANTLNYALYSDSGRTTNWGNTVATDTVTGTGDGTAQSLTVYGRIPSGQGTVPTGAYSDTITVTVTY
jgi:spore coat protein U-like protein